MDLRKTIIFKGAGADVVEVLKGNNVKNLSNIVSRALSEAAARNDFKNILAQEVRSSELATILEQIDAITVGGNEKEPGEKKKEDNSENQPKKDATKSKIFDKKD